MVKATSLDTMKEILENPETNPINQVVANGGRPLVVVHSNDTIENYLLANEGKVSLFYSPIPMQPKFVSGSRVFHVQGDKGLDVENSVYNWHDYINLENLGQKVRRFFDKNPREYYFVSPDKALVLQGMIWSGQIPSEIIGYLGLENRVTSKSEIDSVAGR